MTTPVLCAHCQAPVRGRSPGAHLRARRDGLVWLAALCGVSMDEMDLSEALTADMREPWQRDWTLGILAQHPDDLMEWTARVAYHYSEAGTLEVTAAIWALRAEIQRLRSAEGAVSTP